MTGEEMPGPSGAASGLEYHLHPLVIVNISDHYNRVRLSLPSGTEAYPDGVARVIGCLLGTQTGRTVEVVNSFEMVKGGAGIDQEHLKLRKDQYKEVFPALELIGWYATGTKVHEGDMEVHRLVSAMCNNPVMLLLDTALRQGRRDLPAALLEAETHDREGEMVVQLAPVPYTLVASEAERIAVDQVTKLAGTVGTASVGRQMAAHMTQMGSAVEMLRTQLARILEHLEAVQAGQATPDHAVLRSAAALVRQLPDPDAPEFREAFVRQSSDALVSVYLALLTQGAQKLNDMLAKVSLAHDRGSVPGGRGPMGRGAFAIPHAEGR